jgi:diaminohydroxyphosphoribosylaminopyrimidine deaminase/5-amino-6-(5-phosphoribosylamino)uracil reductase
LKKSEDSRRARQDEKFLSQALGLAARGLGHTHPNPMVGSLVVKNGKVVGSGWHRRLGGPHAEANALKQAGARARGATLYVTLEPCSHYGRTPPCVDAILAAGITRVVIPVKDPHPQVSGRGVRALRRAGVEVHVGLLAREARANNIGYFKTHSTGLPWVTLKLATSLDGKLAPASRRGWLTGKPAVQAAHLLRAHHDAVLVGAGTARLDDPRLTVRAARGGDPLRVVASASLRLPLTGQLFCDPLVRGTIIGTVRPRKGVSLWEKRRRRLEKRGAQVWVLPGRGERVPLRPLFRRLAKVGAYHVLVEGGAELAGSVLAARLADEMQLFLAPMVIGEGVSWAAGTRFETGAAPRLTAGAVEPVGRDWLIIGRLKYGVHRNRRGDGARP